MILCFPPHINPLFMLPGNGWYEWRGRPKWTGEFLQNRIRRLSCTEKQGRGESGGGTAAENVTVSGEKQHKNNFGNRLCNFECLPVQNSG